MVSPEIPVQPASDQSMKQMATFAMQELASGKKEDYVLQQLTQRGLMPNQAFQMIEQLRPIIKEAKKKKYRNQMIAGILWTVAGLAVTIISNSMDSGYGLICWGAVLFGVLDFFVGLFGWLRS